MENKFGSSVCEILTDNHKTLLLYLKGYVLVLGLGLGTLLNYFYLLIKKTFSHRPILVYLRDLTGQTYIELLIIKA